MPLVGRILTAILITGCSTSLAQSLWQKDHPLPPTGLPNPFNLDDTQLAADVDAGRIHALQWPVTSTGPLLPYRPVRCLLDLNCLRRVLDLQWIPFSDASGLAPPIMAAPYSGPIAPDANAQLFEYGTEAELLELNHELRALFEAEDPDALAGDTPPPGGLGQDFPPPALFQPELPTAAPPQLFFAAEVSRPYSFDWWTRWLGLYSYPLGEGEGVYRIPFPGGTRPDYRMGVSLIERNGVEGLTFSCAACHLEELFGRPVLGLTTRFPNANKFLYHGSRLADKLDRTAFRAATLASEAEADMLMAVQAPMQLVDTRKPQALGLDTALAQVGLSLLLRDLAPMPDGSSRPNQAAPAAKGTLVFPVSDSKPSVWWNVKYKNRWLSDGSLVAGNPVITNLLWNEIGRGSDLARFEQWLATNPDTVRQLTAMVYASEAPHITDFFPADRIDIESARRGEVLFNKHCKGCHGVYTKNWSLGNQDKFSAAEKLRTHRVEYGTRTKVKNVGTDPRRRKAIARLTPLNDLPLSKKHGVSLEVTAGYVPPPLVGIWARWPYLHNNSVPTLCDLLKPADQRPDVYYARPARDRYRDFDFACNGYPEASAMTRLREAWSGRRYDTSRPGMSNAGHDDRIILEDGKEVLSGPEKRDLVMFLQTL